MNTIKKLLSTIFISSLLVACGSNSVTSNREVTEGINISENPLGALKKVTEVGEKYQLAQAEIAEQESVKPVHFEDLIELLPQPSADWSAEEATGQTNTFGEYSISQASRLYRQGDRTIEISIADWAYNTGLYASFLIGADFSQESSKGYNKGIKIGDMPGREEYNFASKNGTLSLLAQQRFFIQIEGENIEPEELQKWWNLIDREALSTLK
ncbi:MAG: hypothetical protein Tsb0014_33980 [Pleurocapsa sp.]